MVKLRFAPFLAFTADKEREEIRRRGGLLLVLVDYVLHLLLPSNDEALACLASGVMKKPVTGIGLAEVRQVDKRDAPKIEAHQKGISCQLLLGGELGVETLDVADRFRRNASLTGIFDAGIDILEGFCCGASPFSTARL